MKISRRELLQAIAASGLMLKLPWLNGCDSEDEVKSLPRQEQRMLHFDLSSCEQGAKYHVHVGGKSYELQKHTDETRTRHRQTNDALHLLKDEELTHFATDVEFSNLSSQLYTVTTPGEELPTLLAAGINLPKRGIANAALKVGANFRLGFTKVSTRDTTPTGQSDASSSPQSVTDLADFVNATDAAVFCVYHHPDIISLDPTVSAMVVNHIETTDAFANLVTVIRQKGRALDNPDSHKVGWANAQYRLDLSGNKIPRRDADGGVLADAQGQPLYEYVFAPHDDVKTALGPVVRQAVLSIRNDPSLEGLRYDIQTGTGGVKKDISDSPTTMKYQVASTGTSYTFEHQDEFRYGQAVKVDMTTSGAFKVTVKNSASMHQGVWVAYHDTDGNIIRLTDLDRSDTDASADAAAEASVVSDSEASTSSGSFAGIRTDYMQFLGIIGPVWRLLGIKTSAFEDREFEVELPKKASKLAVLTGTAAWHDGDLRAEYDHIDAPGMAFTIVFELALPTLFLAAGVGGASEELTLKAVVEEIVEDFAVTFVEAMLEFVADHSIGSGRPAKQFFTDFGMEILNELVIKILGAKATIIWAALAATAAVSAAEHSTPVVGWALWLVDAAITAVDIIETMVDMGNARKCVENLITTTHDVQVTLTRETGKYEFPASATRIEISATLSRATCYHYVMPLDRPNVDTIVFPFPDKIPSGGSVIVRVNFLNDIGWIAGSGEVATDNLTPSDKTVLDIPVEIKENLVPLASDTYYEHRMKLAYDSSGAHKWVVGTAPTATTPVGGCTNSHVLCSTQSITFNEALGQVAYSFESVASAIATCGTSVAGTATHQAQNVNLNGSFGNGNPDARLKRRPCGTTRQMHIIYSMSAPEGGLHFALIPVDSGGYELRKISLSADFKWDSLDSAPLYGTFSSNQLACARIHSAGYVLALNADYDKIEVLRLPSQPAAQTQRAPVAGLICGAGSQRGSLGGAVAVAPTFSLNTFIVLENDNRRLQALDEWGKPVNLFKLQGQDTCFAPLKDESDVTVKYLDLCVEYTGFIYVLSSVHSGLNVSDFRLDIYKPTGEWLVRMVGLAAANFALDKSRNIYTMNHEVITYGGYVEPSISQWVPITPSACTADAGADAAPACVDASSPITDASFAG